MGLPTQWVKRQSWRKADYSSLWHRRLQTCLRLQARGSCKEIKHLCIEPNSFSTTKSLFIALLKKDLLLTRLHKQFENFFLTFNYIVLCRGKHSGRKVVLPLQHKGYLLSNCFLKCYKVRRNEIENVSISGGNSLSNWRHVPWDDINEMWLHITIAGRAGRLGGGVVLAKSLVLGNIRVQIKEVRKICNAVWKWPNRKIFTRERLHHKNIPLVTCKQTSFKNSRTDSISRSLEK